MCGGVTAYAPTPTIDAARNVLEACVKFPRLSKRFALPRVLWVSATCICFYIYLHRDALRLSTGHLHITDTRGEDEGEYDRVWDMCR